MITAQQKMQDGIVVQHSPHNNPETERLRQAHIAAIHALKRATAPYYEALKADYPAQPGDVIVTADGTFRAKVTALDVFKGRVVVTAFLIRGDGIVSDQQADTGHFRWADFKVISRGVRKPATPSQAEPPKEKWEVTQIPTSWSDGEAFKSYLADGWEPIGIAPYGSVWTDMEPHIFLRKSKAG